MKIEVTKDVIDKLNLDNKDYIKIIEQFNVDSTKYFKYGTYPEEK